MGVAIEQLKQRIGAIATKINQELNQEGRRCDDDQPHAEESNKCLGRHIE